MNTIFQNDVIKCLELDSGKTLENATTKELYNAVSKAAVAQAYRGADKFAGTKRAAYLSAVADNRHVIGNSLHRLT